MTQMGIVDCIEDTTMTGTSTSTYTDDLKKKVN